MSKHKATRIAPDGAAPRGLMRALLKAGGIDNLRSMTPLPDEAQRLIDQAVVRVGMERLAFVADLLSEGLVYNLPNALGVLELYWEKESRAGYAKRVMLPDARGENQLADRTGVRIPIYITQDDFNFNIRLLMASERSGAPLDTSMVESATRNVNEAIEDAGINGANIQVNGNTAPGLINAPNANTYAYVGNEAWDNSGHTGEEILQDVLAMIDKAQADRRYGPYNLNIPTLYDNKLNQDFKANSDKSIRQRLEEINVGGRPLRIRVVDQMPANRTALVQMTRDVVDVVVGQQPTTLSWEDAPGFNLFYLVMAIVVPRVRDDYEGKSGIVLGNTT